MGKLSKIFLCLLLCMGNQFLNSRENEPGIKDGAIAVGEVLLSNLVVMSFNIFVTQTPWAKPTADSVHKNLTQAWQWEDYDGFIVNQAGHGIQGSVYFNAGRVNGFSFYQSAFFNALGSFTWEAFGENNHASINDFFTTLTSSMSTGEMFYRLYLEAYAAGVPAPLAFLINPMAGFHRLVTGWQPPSSGGQLYQLHYNVGMGFASTRSFLNGSDYNNYELHNFDGFYSTAGLNVIYGNPFEQYSTTPFEHFELALSAGINPGRYLALRLISDGYLVSYSPLAQNENNMTSTGLSLSLDYRMLGEFGLHDSTINHYSNALNWTIKNERVYSSGVALQRKAHLGVTFFGVSKFYNPDFYSYRRDTQYVNNYGYGLNIKQSGSLEHKAFGKLAIDLFGYMLWSYPGTSDLTKARVDWFFADITYTRNISKSAAIGVANYFAMEWGRFRASGFPDTKKINNEVMLFVTYRPVSASY